MMGHFLKVTQITKPSVCPAATNDPAHCSLFISVKTESKWGTVMDKDSEGEGKVR